MNVYLLVGAAGISPWVTLLIVAGLAAYTRHAPVATSFQPYLGPPLLVVVAVFLGLDAVVGKVPRLARAVEWGNVIAAAAVAALLWLALARSTSGATVSLAAVAAVIAAGLQLARRWLARRLDRALLGMGHILTSIVANVAAAGISAVAVALTAVR